MMTQDPTPLELLRAEIDRLDDSILALIEKRLAAADAIAASKDRSDDRCLKIRPRREAAVLARLLEQAERTPAELVKRIWREVMGHALQAQARTELVICVSGDPERIERQVRDRFGSGVPVSWASTPAEALRRARTEEAIAILDKPIQQPEAGLRLFEILRDETGARVAYAIGRLPIEDAAEDCAEAAASIAEAEPDTDSGTETKWHPSSWRGHPAAQMPLYPDADALARVEGRLAAAAPLVSITDIIHLKAHLARVAAGRAFLVQGGDCAESFAEFGADKVRMTFNLLLQMGAMLRARSGTEVVHLARIAGQFAKPRSSPTETIEGVTLPSYRGDAVNGPAFSASSRAPDPRRLLDAHRQAQVTVELIKAYSAASYADLPTIHRAVGLSGPVRPVSMFTSHEALLLNYEEALTRFDEASESWWATSGHMIWIGDRTRALDGAHVEFASGVANPVGIKCGPSLGADDLLRLIDRLDPDNRPGRLVLIGRFGADKVARHLPELMRATRREGRHAIWSIDPMHGNTHSVGSLKTRRLADVLAEVASFFEIARAQQVHPGGVHLEMTGANVTECLGGSATLRAEDLPRRYLTLCDPRLNKGQALDVASAVADLLSGAVPTAKNAA